MKEFWKSTPRSEVSFWGPTCATDPRVYLCACKAETHCAQVPQGPAGQPPTPACWLQGRVPGRGTRGRAAPQPAAWVPGTVLVLT